DINRYRVVCSLDGTGILNLQRPFQVPQGIIERVIQEIQVTLKQRQPARHFTPPLHLDQRTMLELPHLHLVFLKVAQPSSNLLFHSDLGSHRQRVDEHPDHVFESCVFSWPARNYHSEHDVPYAALTT